MKQSCTYKEGKLIVNSLFLLKERYLSCFLRSQASSHIKAAWEDQDHSTEDQLFFLLSPNFHWWALMVSLCQLSWLCPLSDFFGHPAHTYRMGGKKALILCKHGLTTAKRLMCYYHCASPIFKPLDHMDYVMRVNFTPARPSTQLQSLCLPSSSGNGREGEGDTAQQLGA